MKWLVPIWNPYATFLPCGVASLDRLPLLQRAKKKLFIIKFEKLVKLDILNSTL